jgi:hypothetical protein
MSKSDIRDSACMKISFFGAFRVNNRRHTGNEFSRRLSVFNM